MEKIKMTKWQKVKLEEFCDVRDGTHDSPKPSDIGKYLVTSKHIKGGKIDLSSAYKISQSDFDLVNQRSKVDQWDVLISMIGTVGEVCLVSDFPDFAIKNVGLIKTENQNIARYLYYYLKTPTAQSDIKARLKGTTQQYLSLGELRDFPIALPPLDIQKKIAAVLGVLDDKIELNNKINQNLEQQAQSLFKSWFVDFEPFGGSMPDDWKVKTLGDVAFNFSETHKAQDEDELIFINTGDVEKGVFLHSNFCVRSKMPGQAKKTIKKWDILYSEIRPCNKHFALVTFDAEQYIVSTKFMVIRPFNEEDRWFLYFYLTRPDIIKKFQHIAEHRSGTFPQITFESISKTEIVFANKKIQRVFCSYIEKLYAEIFSNLNQNTRLAELRDTLLPKLMSGEINVDNVNA